MQFFSGTVLILTRTQGKKFEDMFFVKIASKETSLNNVIIFLTDTCTFLHDLSFHITKFAFLRSSCILQVAVILLCKMVGIVFIAC